jgi:hypothetical protein
VSPAAPQQRSPVSSKRYLEPDFLTAAAWGDVRDHRVDRAVGVCDIVGTVETDVWGLGGTRARPSVASVLTVSSTSTADDSAGTGVRSIIVQGLLADYTRKTNLVIMDGTTPVSTTDAFIRVQRVGAFETGSTGRAVGTITVSHPEGPLAVILPGATQSLTSHFTIPAGEEALVPQLSYDGGTEKDPVELRILVSLPASAFIPGAPGYAPVQQGSTYRLYGGGPIHEQFRIPIAKVPAKTDLWWVARQLTSGTGRVSVRTDFLLRAVPT